MTLPHAAGSLLVAETTGRVLLLYRADGEGWATPGGMAEPGEEPEATAIRELDEETGVPAILTECVAHYRFVRLDDGTVELLDRPCWPAPPFNVLPSDPPPTATLIYDMFVCTVREEFIPALNDEHRGWTWVKPEAAVKNGPLHPGAECAIRWLLKDYS